MTFTLALQLAIAGISVGSIYALVALAIVIPFKSSGVLNFGQGEIVTLGAYLALILTQLALPYPVVIASVVLLGAAGGVVIERVLIRPIVKAPEFTLVIATFAIGLLIKGVISIRFGDSPNTIDGPFGTEPIVAAGLRFNPTSLWIFACTALVTLGVMVFLRSTRLGKAMRAVSVNPEAARLMGIRVETVYRWSWAISTAIGALAGLLVAPLIGINPEIGQLILRGLLAAVIGGFTSIPGAIVGGLAVGLIETYSGVLIGSTFKNLVPFILLMVLLVFRPQGLFGAPASRLRGIYLALATLGFLQIVQIVIEEFANVTGGVRGLTVPKAAVAGLRMSEYARFLVVLGCCVLAIWTARNLLASRVGRELNAVRLSPHAAQALGVSVHRVRLAAFALSAAFAGVAGGLQAIVVGFIDPVEFGVSAALRQITFIVVGGMGSVGGSVIGAAVLSAMPEILRSVKEYSDVIYTMMLLGFLIFLPNGLVTLWHAVARRMRTRAPAATAEARP